MKPLISLVLFIIGFGWSLNAQNVHLQLPNYQSYGPYYVEDNRPDIDHQVKITNNEPYIIIGKIKVEIQKNGILVCETNNNMPDVTIPPGGMMDYPIVDDSVLHVMNYLDTVFEQEFLDGKVSFLDPLYNVTMTFSYTDEHGGHSQTTLPVPLHSSPSTDKPIEILFPADSATLAFGNPDIYFNWGTPKMRPDLVESYDLKVYEILPGQTAAQAQQNNTPVLDEVVDESQYYWSQMDTLSTAIEYDTSSNYTYLKNYVWVVKSIFTTPYTGFDNSSVATFSIDTMSLPTIQNGDTLGAIKIGMDAGMSLEYLQHAFVEPLNEVNTDASSYKKNDPCLNGDMELGNWKGWEGMRSSSHNRNAEGNRVFDEKGIFYSATSPAGSDHYIYYDPNHTLKDGNIPDLSIVPANGGDYSIRLGDLKDKDKGALLRYTFDVTNQNKKFQFVFALVMADPLDHKKAERPFFQYKVVNNTTGSLIVSPIRKFADRKDPYFKHYQGEWIYRDWSCAQLDLSNHVGDEVTIEFVVSDCSRGGHVGYAYIDGLCGEFEPIADLQIGTNFCAEDDVIADGSASQFEFGHRWTVEESDQWWSRNPTTEEFSPWLKGIEAGTFDVKSFYEGTGREWKCDQYYRVKLQVHSPCGGWESATKLIYIKPCYKPNAGPDVRICNAGDGVLIGATQTGNTSGVTFNWTPGNTSAQQIFVFPNQTTTYTLTATHSNGCSYSDDVMVRVNDQDPLEFELEAINPSLCDGLYDVKVITTKNHGTIILNWLNGNGQSETEYISTPSEYIISDVQVNNNGGGPNFWATATETFCNTSVSHNLEERDPLPKGSIWPELFWFPYIVDNPCPNPGISDFVKGLYIFDKTFDWSDNWPVSNATLPAYRAAAARLTVASRSGTLWQKTFRGNGKGLKSGEIFWNGHMNGGPVPIGVYDFIIHKSPCLVDATPGDKYFIRKTITHRWFGIRLMTRTYNISGFGVNFEPCDQ